MLSAYGAQTNYTPEPSSEVVSRASPPMAHTNLQSARCSPYKVTCRPHFNLTAVATRFPTFARKSSLVQKSALSCTLYDLHISKHTLVI